MLLLSLQKLSKFRPWIGYYMYVDTCLWIRVSFIFPKFVLQLGKLSKSAPFAFQVMAKISVHTDNVVVLIAIDKNGNNYPEIGDGTLRVHYEHLYSG